MSASLATADAAENPRAVLGGNNPPPIEEHRGLIAGLMEQAKQWADGTPITNDVMEDYVKQLDKDLLDAAKAADAQRVAEKQEHDEAAKAVQRAWKPLLDDVDNCRKSLKAVLTNWLRQKEEAARQRQAELEREAAEARAAALAAFQASDPTHLEARLEAERQAATAKELEAIAKRASKDGAKGLRTVYRAKVSDPVAFARWLWANRVGHYSDWLNEMAQHFASVAYLHAPPPGVEVTSEKKA